jgi:hypothetical protein
MEIEYSCTEYSPFRSFSMIRDLYLRQNLPYSGRLVTVHVYSSVNVSASFSSKSVWRQRISPAVVVPCAPCPPSPVFLCLSLLHGLVKQAWCIDGFFHVLRVLCALGLMGVMGVLNRVLDRLIDRML